MKLGRNTTATARTIVGPAIAALTLWAVVGCDPQRRPSDHLVLTGTVEGTRADTGLLLVRVEEPAAARFKNKRIACLLPNDAEIYINDKFTTFDAIEIGDTVELMGHVERNPREERFVVSVAEIKHNEPPPPPLDLSPPTTQPTSQPREK